MSCIFCEIIAGNIPSDKVYEDELCLAFRDINPQAPVHIIVIPKQHIPSMNEVTEDTEALIGHIFTCIPKIAAEAGLNSGYRVISNCGQDAGQTVPHLHFHLLGGTILGEKIL